MKNPGKLNLGCGSRFCNDWINVNFTSSYKGVIAANLGKGIPFHDGSFELVYHSHLLEHFSKSEAPVFLKECFRVLKPGGVIRIVVPDLESIARNYLLELERARAGYESGQHNHEWMLLEMYDQVSRNESGGEMARYLFSEIVPNEQFVVSRCGSEVQNLIVSSRKSREVTQATTPSGKSAVRNILSSLLKPKLWREKLIQLLLGKEFKALQIGRFRLGGENHQWMYDSYSLERMLRDCGFNSIAVRNATESYVPDWASFNLDTEPDGVVYKPDSLFIEAIK